MTDRRLSTCELLPAIRTDARRFAISAFTVIGFPHLFIDPQLATASASYDHSSGAEADAARVAVILARTPVQIAITVISQYSALTGPERSQHAL